jgi:hypothetical protein
MTTRRELLKIASALGLAGTAPTVAERIAVAHTLSGDTFARIALSPTLFTDEMYASLPSAGADDQFCHDWYGSIAPEETAEYDQATDQLQRYFRGAGVDAFHLFLDYTAAFNNLAEAMYQTGLQHGAAFENLRRVLVGDVVKCVPCGSTGLSKAADICTSCGGTGTVALKDSAR